MAKPAYMLVNAFVALTTIASRRQLLLKLLYDANVIKEPQAKKKRLLQRLFKMFSV